MEAEDVALLPGQICFNEDFGYKQIMGYYISLIFFWDASNSFFCRSIFPAGFWLGPDASMACTKVATIFSEPMRSG